MKPIIIIFFAMCLSNGIFAQIQKLENVLSATMNGAGPIISDGVSGYYALYELDQKTKGKSQYQLSVFDENLSPLSTKKFFMAANSSALEASYNGKHLLFKFKTESEDKYTYKMFDQNAQLLRSSSKPSNFLDYVSTDAEATENTRLFPLSGHGFVDYAIKNKKKGAMSKTQYVMHFFPNDSTGSHWTTSSAANSEYYEFADYLGVSGNTLLSLVTKREGAMDRDFEEHILGTDLKTGKKLFERPLEDKKHVVSTLNAIPNEADGSFTIIGLYFEEDAKSFKDKSLGLFAFDLNANGEVTQRRYVSWEKDVAKHLPMTEKGKIKDVGYLFFHRFMKTDDGHYFGIGEEYHRAASGGGIAMAVLTRGQASVVKAVTGDMYVFAFDQNFNLKGIKTYDKAKTNVTLPPGASMMSVRMTGLYMKYYGGFDYQFSQMSRDKTEFSSGYLDYARDKGDKQWEFGTINYSEGRLSSDKIKMDSKATWFRVFPGKPGYVMVTEYFKKQKEMSFLMEKLNY